MATKRVSRRGAKRLTRKVKKTKSHHPKKGQKSLTHKGRLDFTTKKTSKVFHRKGHDEHKSAKGVKRRPYHKRH